MDKQFFSVRLLEFARGGWEFEFHNAKSSHFPQHRNVTKLYKHNKLSLALTLNIPLSVLSSYTFLRSPTAFHY